MLDTSQLESLPPEERAAYGAKIRDKLGLPPDASDWIVIGTLTVLVARFMDEAERSFKNSSLLVADLSTKISHREQGILISIHKRIRGLSEICKFMGWEVDDGQD